MTLPFSPFCGGGNAENSMMKEEKEYSITTHTSDTDNGQETLNKEVASVVVMVVEGV